MNSQAKRGRYITIVLVLSIVTGIGLLPTDTQAQRSTPRRAAPPRSKQQLSLPKIPGRQPRNIIFILTDDHRYDALGFMKAQPFIETPNLNALAKNGVHLKNAFVTTSLCSPSRASILTGLYAHRHRVVDNQIPVSPDLVFFPQYLQRAGYETALIGKWHMGESLGSDEPQRGFDHWVSFKGQGTYLPSKNGLNVNGKRVPQKGYITDELTDYAIEWLEQRKSNKPFMLYLAHKAVHFEFIPAERHRGRFEDRPFVPPKSMALTENRDDIPMWVQNQRNSWHGVEFPFHSERDFREIYRRYAESLLAVDESVGRVVDYLKKKNLFDSTLIIYMGDNGFMFGEHGILDKRAAYEESMRVPMLMQCPELFKAGTVVPEVVANIDIAPTILEAAGLKTPDNMDGKSFAAVAQGKNVSWRDYLLYEYYWERNFPYTPTQHALRGDRYKYIRYHGIWDTDELFNIEEDPAETNNLIRSPAHQQIVREMNRQLFKVLEETGGMYIPLNPDSGPVQNLRSAGGSRAAEFPPYLRRKRKTLNDRD